MSLGENIRKYRKEQHLTQAELGKLIKRSDITIRNYESNRVKPPLKVLEKIADVLDIKISDLSLDEEERKELQSEYELLDPFVYEKLKDLRHSLSYTESFDRIDKPDITKTIENVLIDWFAKREALEFVGIEATVDTFKVGAHGYIHGSQLYDMLFNEYLIELKKNERIKAFIRLRELAEEENLFSPFDILKRPIENQEFIDGLKDYKKKYGIGSLPISLGFFAEFLEADSTNDPEQVYLNMFKKEHPKIDSEEGD